MIAAEIIRRKRDDCILGDDELDFMASGIANGLVSEAQAAAFAMAVFFRGMSREETSSWTRAMTGSGHKIGWNRDCLDGPLLDKHSTGGVGDKVSLVLAPMLAACGAYVPMISGRGLGHTGGTLDKLEAIPGLRTQFDEPEFKKIVLQTGCAIAGATDSLAPADRRLYAVRDVTATVDSVPLITASILSKKLAADLDSLVLDVKTGSGAFAASLDQARELSGSLVAVGTQSGLATVALITDMDQVLGRSAGNAVEVSEAVSYLTGVDVDDRLESLVISLGSEALVLGGLASDHSSAESMLRGSLANGLAAERFQAMIRAQGAPANFMESPHKYLPCAPVVRPVLPERSGYVAGMDARRIGIAVVGLGGGRRQIKDVVDHSVGFSEMAGIGEAVGPGQPIAMVHAASESAAVEASDDLRTAIEFSDTPLPPRPVVIDRAG